jgi:hypothetical protein
LLPFTSGFSRIVRNPTGGAQFSEQNAAILRRHSIPTEDDAAVSSPSIHPLQPGGEPSFDPLRTEAEEIFSEKNNPDQRSTATQPPMYGCFAWHACA